ncbi:helix-turn-helix domain-containing protein [Phytoactinopolyspora halotolerans]|uniref:Helix-turn-helix domain-containing protein n=1 Tax=Phytoactinopolyspora halotolerans TaxID=1981512 RepID=A0A6L9S9I9_9ACTN|nr:helix-turn-helix domain-containing protein [Phytoactinopolyspora halotolerans]
MRRARESAGLTQAELAEVSGVARPNIAAYESGARMPSRAMVRRLLEAIKPRPSSALAAHRDEVRRLARDFGMENPRVFGSAARGDDSPGSDLDLLVRVPRGKGLLALMGFARAVEDVLGVRVDVVSERGLGEGHAGIRRDAVPV